MAPGVSASPLEAHRPTWAEIDLDALLANLSAIRARVGSIPILAVVKANAYGHGATQVARALEEEGVTWFGVALPEEGVELRRAGLKGQILLLGGFAPPQADLVLANDLVPALFRPDQVQALASAAGRRGVRARAHLKIDTGMGRLGVPADEVPAFAEVLLSARERVVLTGAFSHLAAADDPREPTTRLQTERFGQALDALRAQGLRPDEAHLANSAAILDHPPAWLGLVRPGLLLYGYRPSDLVRPFDVEPVLSLRSRIIYVKDVAPGTAIGYGRTYVAERRARIASLGLGYDDGLPRYASNRGYVLVRGCRAPIVGRVSMDLTTVDVTGISGAALGDDAVVLGSCGEERLGADQIAAWGDTIPWEVLCGIGGRVPRLYRRADRHDVLSRFPMPLV